MFWLSRPYWAELNYKKPLQTILQLAFKETRAPFAICTTLIRWDTLYGLWAGTRFSHSPWFYNHPGTSSQAHHLALSCKWTSCQAHAKFRLTAMTEKTTLCIQARATLTICQQISFSLFVHGEKDSETDTQSRHL